MAVSPGFTIRFAPVRTGSHQPAALRFRSVNSRLVGYALCNDLGLDCAAVELVTPAEIDLPEQVDFELVLVVQRFDRQLGRRVHTEEFAQAMAIAPTKKYGTSLLEDYGRMLRLLNERSVRPVQDVDEFLGRMVAFILMGNTDAHLKNWALIYEDGVRPALAPLYDPVCVSSFFAGVDIRTYAQNRQIDKTLCAFGWDQFEALMDAAGLSRKARLLQKCRAHVRAAKANWPDLMDKCSAPPAVKKEIIERLQGKVAIAAA